MIIEVWRFLLHLITVEAAQKGHVLQLLLMKHAGLF